MSRAASAQDRTRRHASASEFAAGINRYLKGLAVVARPAGVLYRFVCRHKAGVAAATLAILALVTGLTVSTLFFLSPERARRAADDEQYEATISAADLLSTAGQPGDARERPAPEVGSEGGAPVRRP